MNLRAAKMKFGILMELTKPGISGLVLVSTSIGFYLGSKTAGGAEMGLYLMLLLGSALSAGGVAALNEYWERDLDAKMMRTKDRPLPSGRLTPREALLFAVGISSLGIAILTFAVHPGTGLLALLTLTTYIFVYTPLKRRTTWNTVIGALPGALPPLGGWLAATGELAPGAWALFLILFAWQIPHFLAIATIYRDDYRLGGMQMLPAMPNSSRATAAHIMVFSLILLVASMLPTYYNLTGPLYLTGAVILGMMLLGYAAAAARNQVAPQARKLMFASIVYLPALLAIMVADLEFFG